MSDIGTWSDDVIGNLVARLVVQHNIRFDASAAIFDALEMVRDDYQAKLDAANERISEQEQRIAELEGQRDRWRAESLRLRDAIMQMDSGNLQQAESEGDDE